jgi:hypothetical protein
MFANLRRKAAFTALLVSAVITLFSFKAAAWGAELHLSWTYMYALGKGYGHQDSYLLGMLNYDIDIGDTSSFPIKGAPEYHFDYLNELERTGVDARDRMAVKHILASWKCAFEGDDEGFLYNTAAALHPLQDKDAHLDKSILYHAFHFTLGTIIYGDGWYYSWLDDPFSDDVFTVKMNPTVYSERAFKSLRNTVYILDIQKPLYDLVNSDNRAQQVSELIASWSEDAAKGLGLGWDEAQSVAGIGGGIAADEYAVPVSRFCDDYDFAEMAQGGSDRFTTTPIFEGEGGEGQAVEARIGASVLDASLALALERHMQTSIAGLFELREEWEAAIGLIDEACPMDCLETIREVFIKSAQRAICKALIEDELAKLHLEAR